MTPQRFEAITSRYAVLRLAVVGDFCLDRYLEIDPARAETSLETGLAVRNVVCVRAQPGGAGTILNNLAALGVGTLYPVGFAGDDGEGYELCRALSVVPGVRMDHFLQTSQRATFTYCKPLVLEPGQTPRELNRLDRKNWTQTPAPVEAQLSQAVRACAGQADALAVLSQVDVPETGVLTAGVRAAVQDVARTQPAQWILADSRHGLQGFPALDFKMNSAELAVLMGTPMSRVGEVCRSAAELARANGRAVFVTLAANGMVGALPDGQVEHVPALPVQGEIDVVGAGDAVTANLTSALACGASLREALVLANTAASIVIHQLGTTGTATIDQLRARLFGP
jgi:rfaE bifunctional protein kinase chain/domain